MRIKLQLAIITLDYMNVDRLNIFAGAFHVISVVGSIEVLLNRFPKKIQYKNIIKHPRTHTMNGHKFKHECTLKMSSMCEIFTVIHCLFIIWGLGLRDNRFFFGFVCKIENYN